MKTMGIEDLRIVGDVSFDVERAFIVAVRADGVLKNAGRHSSVCEAVAGCSLIAGATRRWGKHRKLSRLTPTELSGRILSSGGAPIAIVFGNESSGLDDEELNACHLTVTIPSSPAARSLNLSHAVQIVCYEVYRRFHEAAGKRFYTPVTGERLDDAMTQIADSFARLGSDTKPHLPLLRDIVARAALSNAEIRRFEALFTKLAGMSSKRKE